MQGGEQWRVGIEDFAMSYTAGRWVVNIIYCSPKDQPSSSRVINTAGTSCLWSSSSSCLVSQHFLLFINQVQHTFSIQTGSD